MSHRTGNADRRARAAIYGPQPLRKTGVVHPWTVLTLPIAAKLEFNMNHEPDNCWRRSGVRRSVRLEPSPRVTPAGIPTPIRAREDMIGRIARRSILLVLGSIFAIVWSDSSRATSCYDHRAAKACSASAEIVHRSGQNFQIQVSYEPIEKCAKITIHLGGMEKYPILERFRANVIEQFVNEDALWGVKSPVHISKRIDLLGAAAGSHDQEYINSAQWGTPAGMERSSERKADDIGSILGEDLDSILDKISVRRVECTIHYSKSDEQTADEKEQKRLAREEERKRLALERREQERERLADQRRREEERERLADRRRMEEERQRLADQQRRERERQRVADQRRRVEERQRLAQWQSEQQRQHLAQEQGGADGLQDFLETFSAGLAFVQRFDEVFGDGSGSPGYVGQGLGSGSITGACQQAQVSASRRLASQSFSGGGSQCGIYRSYTQMLEGVRRELATAGCPAYALGEYDRAIAEARRGAAIACN